jgi:glutaredoxin
MVRIGHDPEVPMKASILVLLVAVIAGTAHAGELYRWVDESGRVHYTDQPPPPQARSAERKRLGDKAGQGPVPYALQRATKNFPVTVYTSTDCGEGCEAAIRYLNRRGVPFTQKDARQDENASALKALTGGKLEVPVAAVGSDVLRGFEENAWKTALDAAGYPSSAVRPVPAKAAQQTTDSPVQADQSGRTTQ